MHFFKNTKGQTDTKIQSLTSSFPLDSLPTEVLWEIFSYSNPADVTALAQVNKSLYNSIINAHDFWESMYRRHFSSVGVETVEDKTWYEVFMDTYKADYPQPEVRRLVFLIKAQDHLNLSKFISQHQEIIMDLLDIPGKLSKKTPLEHAQESGNQKILDSFYQAVDQKYRASAKKIANNELISRAISISFTAAEKSIAEKDFQKKIVKTCIIDKWQNNEFVLQDEKIKTSNLAIADHHDVTKDRVKLEDAARDCIEINMSTATAKTIVQHTFNNQTNITKALLHIHFMYLRGRDSLNYVNDKALVPIIDLFRIHIENGIIDTNCQALVNLIQEAEDAAYTSKSDEQGRTILYWAIACHQNTQIITGLLKMGSSLIERYMHLGYRPFHIAAQHGYNDIVQVLLQNGAKPYILNSGDSIFVDYFNAESFEDYLQQRIDGYREDKTLYVEVCNVEFECAIPVHLAAKYGHKDLILSSIQLYPSCTTSWNNDSQKLIDVAVASGQVKVVEALLQLSQKFFTRTDQDSLLLVATEHKELDVMIYLVNYLLNQRDNLAKNIAIAATNQALETELGKGNYINITTTGQVDEIFQDYLVWATQEKEFNFIESFVSTIYKRDPEYLNTLVSNSTIHLNPVVRNIIEKVHNNLSADNAFSFVKNGDIPSLSQTLTSLTMVDKKNKQGQSLLEVANQEKNPQVFDCIYQLALDFHTKDGVINHKKQSGEPRTILYWAIVCHQDENIIQELLDKGCKVNEKYFTDNYQPLHIAVQHGNNEIIPFLTKAGASPKAPDLLGRLPIHIAIEQGNLEAVKLFLAQDKSLLKELDSKKRTLLHLAARSGHREIIDVLIKNGCDHLSATDAFGMQAIHIAAKEGQLSAMKSLLERSGDLLEAKDDNGRTPLAIALIENKTDIAKYLITEKGANLDIVIDRKTPYEIAELYGNTELSKAIAQQENCEHRDKRQPKR